METDERIADLPLAGRASEQAKAHLAEDELLFDEFWHQGEVALLFGGASSGKSILAVQIADAIARGRPIVGFAMPTGSAERKKVLYVDMNSTDRQFSRRYAKAGLSTNLYRLPIDRERDIVEKIESFATANGIGAIIVDSLEELKHTLCGVRETIGFMREIRSLSRRLGISILVLAAEDVRGNSRLTPMQKASTRPLCLAADSVFLIREYNGGENDRYLEQLRTRSACISWPIDRAPAFQIELNEDGMPVAVFDERFSPEVDLDTKDRLMTIAMQRNAGFSYRDIAEQMALGKSYVHKLHRRWSRHAERWIREAEAIEAKEKAEAEKAAAAVAASDAAARNAANDECGSVGDPNDNATRSITFRPEGKPFLAALGRASILDLMQRQDQNGDTIYVEEWSDAINKPMIWYRRYNGNKYRRFVRDVFGTTSGHIFSGHFLDRSVRLNV